MGAVPRRNKLPQAREDELELAIHGKWRRGGDANGEYGCWYLGVQELVEAFGAAAVREKLASYAAEQAAARERAVVAAEAAIAEAAEAAEAAQAEAEGEEREAS